jgi:type II secretory pathway component PulF
LVQASERGGFMVEVLDELLQMDDKRLRLQATMKSALSYPVFLAGFSALVVVFVLLVVFPKFADMFEAIADDLPGTTKMLMALSDSMLAYWPLYLAGIVGVVGAFWGWKHSGAGRETLDKLKLSVPVVRTIYSELYLVQSMRVIGLSLDKGVSVMDTLSSSRDVVDNSVYRTFFRSLEEDVQQGRGLSHGFRQSEYIPDLVKQMVTTGEASGKLPKVLGRVAQYYERQLEQRLQNLSKAAEPVMLLVMGVVVGVLVSSLILPIFQMSRMTH